MQRNPEGQPIVYRQEWEEGSLLSVDEKSRTVLLFATIEKRNSYVGKVMLQDGVDGRYSRPSGMPREVAIAEGLAELFQPETEALEVFWLPNVLPPESTLEQSANP